MTNFRENKMMEQGQKHRALSATAGAAPAGLSAPADPDHHDPDRLGSGRPGPVVGFNPDPGGVRCSGNGGVRVAPAADIDLSQGGAVSLADVFAGFDWQWLDAAACRRFVLTRFYPAGPVCPDCGAPPRPGRATDSWWALRRVHCHKCDGWYRATKHTLLQHSNIDIRQVAMLVFSFTHGLNNTIAAALAGVNAKTVHNWLLKWSVTSASEAVNDNI